MADINALYSSLLAADEARDAAALAAVAWQMYGQLATTAADLGALRARFRAYATSPHASGSGGRPCEEPRPTPARRLRSRAERPHGEMSVQMRKLTAAASVALGTVEQPAQGARPYGFALPFLVVRYGLKLSQMMAVRVSGGRPVGSSA